MSELVRVRGVDYIDGRRLLVTFSDGLVRELDFAGVLNGLLATIDEEETFRRVRVDPVAGTISWPNGIDFDPDVLHGDRSPAAGASPAVVREYFLQNSGR